MHTRSILALIVAAGAACSIEKKQSDATTDTSRAASPTPRATDTAPTSNTPSTPRPGTSTWTVTANGIGAIRVGMSIRDLREVAGDVPSANPTAECSYVRPGATPPGVLVMLARGQVARVDVDSTGVPSDAGVAVGDSAARVTAAYAGRVTSTPHKYVPGGQYLTVKPTSPADSARRMVFETENGRVTRFRSGRVPEVEWVERCG